MSEKLIYLVRHGQPARDPHPARRGPSLTALGREQARLTAAALAGEPVDIVHCSTLRRAEETAAIIAERLPGVPVRRSPLLCEFLPEVSTRFVQDRHAGMTKETARARLDGDPAFRDDMERALCELVGVDAAAAPRFRARAERAFERYFAHRSRRARTEVIVCHGNLIRHFVCRALGVPAGAWDSMDTYLCSITRILVHPNGLRILLSFGETGHLPRELRFF